jgi:ribosome maturation factor RimP
MRGKRVRVVDLVEELVTPYCQNAGLELVDVEFVKEGPYRYLRVMIDKEGGVSLDDCSEVSKFLNKKLDERDPIEENYFLEVTSPGVERELKKAEDFERFSGSMVQAKLYQPISGEKLIKGILKGIVDNTVQIERNGQIVEIPKDKISVIKLVVDFDKED